MTAEPLTAAEAATLARFEAAPPAEESAVERVARAIHGADRSYSVPWDDLSPRAQADYRRLADAAITAMRPAPDTAKTDEGAADCWCIACEHLTVKARTDAGDPLAMFARRFIVCPDCGNKRCPRATHHSLACTGSNEPGQPGSAYASVGPPATVQEVRDRILGTTPDAAS